MKKAQKKISKPVADPEPPPVDETRVLFPEEQVGPYTLRPWGLEQFGRAVPVLVRLLEAFIATGLEIKQAKDFTDKDALNLVPAAAPFFPELIGISLQLPPAEVAQIGPGLQMALGLKIQNQNAVEIKNFFAGFLGMKNPAKKEKTIH